MPDISDRYNGRIEASLAEQRLRRFGKDRGKPCQSEQHPAGFLYLISICERRGNPPSWTKQGCLKQRKKVLTRPPWFSANWSSPRRTAPSLWVLDFALAIVFQLKITDQNAKHAATATMKRRNYKIPSKDIIFGSVSNVILSEKEALLTTRSSVKPRQLQSNITVG